MSGEREGGIRKRWRIVRGREGGRKGKDVRSHEFDAFPFGSGNSSASDQGRSSGRSFQGLVMGWGMIYIFCLGIKGIYAV